MADEQLLAKIHSLGDLELAALLCLISREHCLISTVPDSVDELAEELRLVAANTFNLSSAIVNCHAHTTLDEFASALLIRPDHTPPSPSNTRSESPYRPRHEQPQPVAGGPSSSSASYFASTSPRIGGPTSPSSLSVGAKGSSSQVPQPRIANVILAKDLDRAPRAVQIQALELLRTRRIFTRTSVQTAPKQFLFVALVGAATGGQARVTPHLNDFLYLSHWHDPDEDGFPHLDEEYGSQEDGDSEADDGGASTASSDSVVKLKPPPQQHSASGAGLGLSTYPDPSRVARSSNNDNTSSSTNSNVTNHYNSNSISRRSRNNSSSRSSNSDNDIIITIPSPPFISHPPLPSNPSAPDSCSPPLARFPTITEAEISHLARLSRAAHVPVEVIRYQADLACFLRTGRAAAPAGGGATPSATRHLALLSRALAPLHGLDYVTPSLVALAARKVYLHRLETVAGGINGSGDGDGGVGGVGAEAGAEEGGGGGKRGAREAGRGMVGGGGEGYVWRERSLQWGSDPQAVAALVAGVGPEDVLEEVLGLVKVPV